MPEGTGLKHSQRHSPHTHAHASAPIKRTRPDASWTHSQGQQEPQTAKKQEASSTTHVWWSTCPNSWNSDSSSCVPSRTGLPGPAFERHKPRVRASQGAVSRQGPASDSVQHVTDDSSRSSQRSNSALTCGPRKVGQKHRRRNLLISLPLLSLLALSPRRRSRQGLNVARLVLLPAQQTPPAYARSEANAHGTRLRQVGANRRCEQDEWAEKGQLTAQQQRRRPVKLVWPAQQRAPPRHQSARVRA